MQFRYFFDIEYMVSFFSFGNLCLHLLTLKTNQQSKTPNQTREKKIQKPEINQPKKWKTKPEKDKVLSRSDCDADNHCKSTRQENNEVLIQFSNTFYSMTHLLKLANISTFVLFDVEWFLLETFGYFNPV